MTLPILAAILCTAVAFGLGIWLGYRVATVKPKGEPVPEEHVDLWI